MKNTAIIVEAETIQVPNKVCAPSDDTYTAIVVRIDVQGVEKTQQIVLQCSTRHYRRLKDALGGSEGAIRKVLEGVAANIVRENDSLANNLIIFDRNE